MKHQPDGRLSEAVGVLVLLAACLPAWRDLRYGIDFTDEGLYLSAPMRYALGDRPFQDEWLTAMMPFDVLLWPLFALFQEIGVLDLRRVGFALQALGMVALYLTLKRFTAPPLAALAAAALGFTKLSSEIWTPGYNLLGAQFFTLASCLLVLAALASTPIRRRGLAIASGVSMALSVLAYLPAVAMLAAPLALVGLRLAQRRCDAWCRAATLHLATFAGLAGVTLAALAITDRLGAWQDAATRIAERPGYALSLTEKLWRCVRVLLDAAPFALAVTGVLFAAVAVLARVPRGKRGWLGLLVPLAAAAAAYGLVPLARPFTEWPSYRVAFCLLAAAWAFHATALCATDWRPAVRRPADETTWRTAWALLLGGHGIYFLVQGTVSATGPLKSLYAIGPIFALGVLALRRTLFADPGPRESVRRRLLPLLALVAVVLALSAWNYREVMGNAPYRDRKLSLLDTEFRHPRLLGIRSTSERVEAIEGVLAQLETRLEHGDFLLAYDNLPLFYFLTQTRPALPFTWVVMARQAELNAAGLRHLLAEGRVPEYCLRTRVFPSTLGLPSTAEAYATQRADLERYAFHAWVEENYELDAVVEPFEILRRVPHEESTDAPSQTLTRESD